MLCYELNFQMYGENTNTMAISYLVYHTRVILYPKFQCIVLVDCQHDLLLHERESMYETITNSLQKLLCIHKIAVLHENTSVKQHYNVRAVILATYRIALWIISTPCSITLAGSSCTPNQFKPLIT